MTLTAYSLLFDFLTAFHTIPYWLLPIAYFSANIDFEAAMFSLSILEISNSSSSSALPAAAALFPIMNLLF